jgi:lipopolysaccharide/colanic/teichoic acid biosynthesis glycosyltransferase
MLRSGAHPFRSWLLPAREKAALLQRSLEEGLWRLLELSLALIGLALLFAMLPVLAIAIRLDSPGPVFYRQWRVGHRGQPFRIWKLRTMYKDAEADGRARWAAPEDPRVTRVGRWLRRHRLDELPQVLNVLKGEMSLVGPRPERPEIEAELRKHIPGHERRYEVKPGIFSLSMLHVGYVDSLEKARARLHMDLLYISHRSFWTNLRILGQGLAHSLRGQSR